MLKFVFIFLFIYFFIVIFSILSEITYKKSLSSVINNYKRILLKSFLATSFLIIITFIYMYLGIRFEN
jgi:hypothetical protein